MQGALAHKGEVMSEAIRPWPLVKEGDNHHPVESVQYLLHQRRHLVTIDRIYGPKTTAGVKAFQAGKKPAQDGEAGRRRRRSWPSRSSKGRAATPCVAGSKKFVFRKENLAVDGIFGPRTDAAVKGSWKGLGEAGRVRQRHHLGGSGQRHDAGLSRSGRQLRRASPAAMAGRATPRRPPGVGPRDDVGMKARRTGSPCYRRRQPWLGPGWAGSC